MSLYLGKSKIGNVGCGPLKIGGGTDTSDATVTAVDLAKDIIAYGKNGKITGVLPKNTSGTITLNNASASTGSGYLITKGQPSMRMIVSNNTSVEAKIALSNFGNATAADVAAGKTFTSAAGLKVTGTASSSGGTSTTAVDSIKNNAQIKKENASQVA